MKIKLILIFLFIFLSVRTYAETSVSEDPLKAAFIFHFINFTEWHDDLSNYYVCIPDDDFLRKSVEDSLRGKMVNHRNIVVLRRSPICHVLVSNDVPPQEDNTLTIGELNRGALLEFRIINNKLKFAANLDKIERCKLKISSQLLKLAILENT